jgi:hypothetical protein
MIQITIRTIRYSIIQRFNSRQEALDLVKSVILRGDIILEHKIENV